MSTLLVATLPDSANDPLIAKRDELFAVFHESEKPASEWRIGAEMEKPGVHKETGAPIPYEGKGGVRSILEYMAKTHQWVPEREYDGGPLIALLRRGASITLEPGGQLELSGAPLDDVHLIDAEFHEHLAELAPISEQLSISWLGLGFTPFARREDLQFVPKQRYGIMREYLPKRGGHALDMMLRTCTVQANYDYVDEADAIRKLRVALKLSPLTTALFANSPWKEKSRWGGVSYRGEVWLDVDPDRSGLVPSMWDEQAGYSTYIDWALDVPMFLVKRHGKVIHNTGQTFRSYWQDGFEGHKATLGDWQMHLNTLFPEVRLKKTLEIRGADAQGADYACALPALWTGLLYDEKALAEADALVADWTFAEVEATRPAIAKEGVRAQFRGKPWHEVGSKIIEIAEGGLARRSRKNAAGKDEGIHLQALKTIVAKGQCPADVLLATAKTDNPADVIAAAKLPST